jgi:hypothetical protein
MKGFNSLELFFKRDFLRKNCRRLISTISFEYTISLYCWNGFFIEQYYDIQRREVTKIVLAGKKDLEKYMKEISLADLGVLTVL